MAHGIPFKGANIFFGPPPGKEDAINGIAAFTNGVCVVSCWELTDEEIAEIVKTKQIWCSVMSGQTMYPHYVGTESVVRELNADYGLWKKEENNASNS